MSELPGAHVVPVVLLRPRDARARLLAHLAGPHHELAGAIKGPPEVLAHVAEMVRYWLGEIERIVSDSPAPASFGRIATDPVRIAIVGRDRTVPLRDLWDRIDSDCARWERRLAELSAAELARAGIHPLAGSMTAGEVVLRFVVAHLTDHAAQLSVALKGPSPAQRAGTTS